MRVNTRSRRVLASAVAAGASLALMAGCASSSSSSGDNGGGSSDDKTFVFGASADPVRSSTAPYVSDGESLRVIDQIYETLVTLTPGTTDVVPQLAESWTASADGLAWTFKLRQGVKFQDGTDFNGDAVCFNFDRWYNFKGAAQGSNLTVLLADRVRRLRHARTTRPRPTRACTSRARHRTRTPRSSTSTAATRPSCRHWSSRRSRSPARPR